MPEMSYRSTTCCSITYSTTTESADVQTDLAGSRSSLQGGSLPRKIIRPNSGKPFDNHGLSPADTSHSLPLSQEAIHLNHLREEVEWEHCSRNPEVVKLVKSRNLTERNRLTALHSQMERQLERKLKRMNMERRDFTGILDSLKIKGGKFYHLPTSSAKNAQLRSLKSVNSQKWSSFPKHDQYEMQTGVQQLGQGLILPKGVTQIPVIIDDDIPGSTGNVVKNSPERSERRIISVSSTPNLLQFATAQKLQRLLSSSAHSRVDLSEGVDVNRNTSTDDVAQLNRTYSGEVNIECCENKEGLGSTEFHSTTTASSTQSSLSSFGRDNKIYCPVQFVIDD